MQTRPRIDKLRCLMVPGIYILIQMLCSIGAGYLLATRLLHRVRPSAEASFAQDVGLPLILILPLVSFATMVQGDIAGAGRASIGGPMAVGILAVGMMGLGHATYSRPPAAVLVRWTCATVATGLVFLLSAALNELPTLVGQSGLAIAAMLMWLNSPDHHDATCQNMPREDWLWYAVGLLVFAQCLAVIGAGTGHVSISGGISMAWAIAVLVMLAVMVGPVTVFRAGGWAAVYGPLVSVSVVTLPIIIPAMVRALRGEYIAAIPRTATGMVEIAIEAVAFLLLPIAVFAIVRVHRTAAAFIGGLILGAGGLLVLGRLLAGW